MRRSVAVLFTFVFGFSLLSYGQGLPVIHASSAAVDIRDGHNFRKAHWTIDPKLGPDTYFAARSKHSKKVAF